MIQGVVLLLMGLGLPLGMALTGASSWSWLGLGAAAWAAALLVKVVVGAPLHHLFRWMFRGEKARSAAWGCWSGIAELGLSAVVFLIADSYPKIWDLVGFGIGAGSMEVLFVIIASFRGSGRGSTAPGPEGTLLAWSGVIERGLTSVGHLATRGLVWAGLQHPNLTPGIVLALATFTLVDGIATYGSAAGWDWEEPQLLRRFYGLLAAVTLVEVAAFVGMLLLL